MVEWGHREPEGGACDGAGESAGAGRPGRPGGGVVPRQVGHPGPLLPGEHGRLPGAGALLAHACADMARLGCPTLYLVTEHTSFYERYGWQFLCMVPEADSPCLLRMYRHRI